MISMLLNYTPNCIFMRQHQHQHNQAANDSQKTTRQTHIIHPLAQVCDFANSFVSCQPTQHSKPGTYTHRTDLANKRWCGVTPNKQAKAMTSRSSLSKDSINTMIYQ